MEHGHPETYDDSILESGNANAKKGKRILFWGGTSEPGATYTCTRDTGKRDKDGKMITKLVTYKANGSVEEYILKNTWMKQTLQARRRAGRNPTRELASAELEAIKHELFACACENTGDALARIENALS